MAAPALNRGQALGLWRRALGDSLRRKGPDLTSRQMAILLTVYLGAPPHTVRGLAADLLISKPAVSRALDTLAARHFVRRKRDQRDRRSVLVERTVKGAVFLSDFADVIARAARQGDN